MPVTLTDQMAAQGCWERDSPLLQLPHFTKELAAAATKAGVESVFDLTDMEVHACAILSNVSLIRPLSPLASLSTCVHAAFRSIHLVAL